MMSVFALVSAFTGGVVILMFDLVWLYFYRGESSVRELLMRLPVVDALFVVTPLLTAAAMWYRRRGGSGS